MVDVSVVIPARNEKFLMPTIMDILKNARTDIEVIAVLEGYWPEEEMVEDPRVRYVHFTIPRGMRGAINAGVALAVGEHIIKCDAHCAFAPGFDQVLIDDLEPDWISVPRRHNLITELDSTGTRWDGVTWEHGPKRNDYLYLCYPDNPNDRGGATLHGRLWEEKNRDKDLLHVQIDDLMSAQGSCWCMHREYFYYLELLDEDSYGPFSNEFQEIGLKCQLSGGRVIRNKKTYYSHLHKGNKFGRGWFLSKSAPEQAAAMTNKWMEGRNWHKQDRDIRWLINEFWPVPGWPEESVRLVFHRRGGGSGDIRGTQMADYFKARINPKDPWNYPFDVHIWVKQQPGDLSLPGKHYLDILDASERISWLTRHPECGVIASSLSSFNYLKEKLNRGDIILIPQHHCNFERVQSDRTGVSVAGVVGGPGAIQCDLAELERVLGDLGIEFRWLQRYRNIDEIVEFYRGIDLQIVWRTQQRPMKNPLKIINAMSFGIPTIAYPEPAYEEVEGEYWPARDMGEVRECVGRIRDGVDRDAYRLIAESYHIDNVSKMYHQLLES